MGKITLRRKCMNKDFPRIMTLLRKERGLSQKQAAAPTMRNVVTDKAENSISADLPMGAISPHKILAVRANMCPCTFLFILFFLLRLQKNNYFLKLKSLFSFYILVVCWKYMSDVLYLYVGRVASICRMCRIYISNTTHILMLIF